MNYQPLIPENLIRKIKEDRGAFTVDSVIELLEGMNQLHYNEFKKEQSKAKTLSAILILYYTSNLLMHSLAQSINA